MERNERIGGLILQNLDICLGRSGERAGGHHQLSSKRGIVFWGPAAITATALELSHTQYICRHIHTHTHTHTHTHSLTQKKKKKKRRKKKKKKRRGVTVGHSPSWRFLYIYIVCVYRHKLKFPVPNARSHSCSLSAEPCSYFIIMHLYKYVVQYIYNKHTYSPFFCQQLSLYTHMMLILIVILPYIQMKCNIDSTVSIVLYLQLTFFYLAILVSTLYQRPFFSLKLKCLCNKQMWLNVASLKNRIKNIFLNYPKI